jgi:hypothetical protein
MKLSLQRDESTQVSTTGVLSVNGMQVCHTLELPDTYNGQKDVPDKTCIPAGIYPVVLAPSQKFGRVMPLLQRVPGRYSIEIHWGNTAEDTLGCILVGTYHPYPDEITGSKLAFGMLFPQILSAHDAGEQITIEILEPNRGEAPQ